MPRDEPGQKGKDHLFALRLKPRAHGQGVPSGSVLPVARSARRGRGTAGEGTSNLGVGSET